MAFDSNLHISLKNIIQMHTWDDRYVNIWDRHTTDHKKGGKEGYQMGILSSVTYAINDKSPVALFTKIGQYNLNFFTYDFPKTIPKSFSQTLSYDKF